LLSKEITNYATQEVTQDIYSNITTIKEGITKIAHNQGYEKVTINFDSQLEDDGLPMLVNVDGRSMVPTLHDGEKLIIEKTKNIKAGDIVVANSSEYGLIIKRVNKTVGNEVYLISDNKNIETVVENGVVYEVVGVKTWVNINDIVGVAKILNA